MYEARVKVEDGVLVGELAKTDSGKEYFSFRGIPYAEPPRGNLRFKSPVPKTPWVGERDAKKDGHVCPQMSFFNGCFIGDEDCLFLNISTPTLSDGSKNRVLYPVMVYIHGGVFVGGSGNKEEFGPDFFIENDVILISINYRLGPLGFLCLDIPEVPGNAGLKDQSLALKWVHNNIEVFNGDPNNITIFGVSAGSASVEFHLISPMSKNLFQKAIMQSGSSLNPWALTKERGTYAKRLGKSLDIETTNPYTLLDYLQNASLEEIVANSFKLIEGEAERGKLFAFTPVVEKIYPDVQPFLDTHPHHLLSSGNFMNVPTITGFCENEGAFLKLFYQKHMDEINRFAFSQCVPLSCSTTKEESEIDRLFKKTYIPSDTNEFKVFDEFFLDLTIVYGVYRAIKYRLKYESNAVKNYVYFFAFQGNFSTNNEMLKNIKGEGAKHGSDIAYFTKTLFNIEDESMEKDHFVRKRMVRMWTDFAKYGNPTPQLGPLGPLETVKWKEITEENFDVLKIDDDISMVPFPWIKRMTSWKTIDSEDDKKD